MSNVKVKYPYTGTTPTQGMTDDERKTYIRRRILDEFEIRKINCTINDDRVINKAMKTSEPSEVAGVWYDLHEEFLTDEPALFWLDYHFGKNDKDDFKNLRFRIYENVYKKYCRAVFRKPKNARQIFLDYIDRCYIDVFDLCSNILAERGTFVMDLEKVGKRKK